MVLQPFIEEASKLYPRGCIWFIENFAYSGLWNMIRSLMQEELTPISMGDIAVDLSRLQNAYNFARGNLTTVERMVRGLAKSVTAAMRNHPHEGESTPEDGEWRTARLEREALGSNLGLAYEVETCVIVNWGWMTYPALLLALQVIFCVTMLLVRPTGAAAAGTARDAGEFSDWKSSPLALVSLGWGDSLHRKLKPLFSAKDIDNVVGRTKVMLRRSEPDDPRATRWQLDSG